MSCNCIKCGREIPEGQMLCEICSLPQTPAAAAPRAPAPKKSIQKKKKQQTAFVKKAANRKTFRKLVIALVIICLVFAASITLTALQADRILQRIDDLRAREASVALREKEAENRDNRIKSLEKELAKEKSTVAALNAQLDADESGTAPGNAAAAAQELRALRVENLTQDLTIQSLEKALAFYHGELVLTLPGDTHYHHFGCEKLGTKGYKTCTPKEAKAAELTPCEFCAKED